MDTLQHEYEALRQITISAGQLGLSTLDIEGRAVVVRNSHGKRVACGVLLRPDQNLLASIGDYGVRRVVLYACAYGVRRVVL